jgi:ABC-type polysaccharide/polyol phosphate export permease
MLNAARQHFPLLWSFTHREISFRFAGSVLGGSWALLGPVLLLGIYSLVFGQLFRQRADLSTESYTFYVALGFWPWMMFADGLLRGMMAIQANASIVKKIAFPHVLLVVAAVSAVFLQHLAGYLLVLLLLITTGTGTIKPAGIPPAILQLLMLFGFTLGIAMILASLQTFLRDIEQAIVPVVMMLHYLTPVMYPPSLIPADYRWILDYNPLAVSITRIRENLLAGPAVTTADILLVVATFAALLIGYSMFARLSPHFEDFL